MPTLPPIPFAPGRVYDPTRSENTIMQLMLRQGDIAANRAANTGQIWGNTIANLGGIAGQYIQQKQADETQQKRAQAVNQVMQTWDGQDPAALFRGLVPHIGPEPAIKVASGLAALAASHQKAEADPKDLALTTGGLAALEQSMPGYIQNHWQMIAPTVGPLAKKFGIPVTPDYQPEYTKAILALNDQLNPGKPETGFTLGPDQVRFDATGKQIAAGPAKPKKEATVGSFEDYVQRKYGDEPTPAQIEQARKGWSEAGHVTVNMGGMAGLYNATDPKAIAEGIESGSLPPQVNQYGRAVTGAVATELAKKGYNLAQANMDWQATQKHLATLNGAQQTRLRQAVDTATHSLDVIEDLAKQWQGSKFPLLNRAQLVAAKNGALGTKAQQIATQLEAQISDVTSELGNVYMGGNSPTDHALGLAAKNLNAEWSLPQLQAAIDLSRKNLRIRANSMVNVGVAGASADNPYAFATAAPPGAGAPGGATSAPGGFSVKAPNGKTYTFSTAEQLAAFKKRAGIP